MSIGDQRILSDYRHSRMKKQNEVDEHLVRSGERIRESVRCLPRGHFQQIRLMFDKQNSRQLPITDDEKLREQQTNIDDIIFEDDQQYSSDTRTYPTLLPLTSNQQRQLAMSAAVNYPESYESSSSNQLNRIGSTRQYVASLQRPLPVQAKPIVVKTTCNVVRPDPSMIYDSNQELFHSSKRLHSSTSLSSTGYDSNSSPSMISKRNSLITNSSSSEDRQRTKPWILYEPEPITIANSYSSDNISDSPPLISRSHIKLIHSPTSTLERRPVSVVRHTVIRKPSVLDSPSISSTSSSVSAKYIVQTTSFPDGKTKISSADFRKKYNDLINQQRSAVFTPIVVQKQINQREESPLPVVENPLFQPPPTQPPQKPPRTFEQENRYDQKVPSSLSSSSSSSHSPLFDLGARSVSCMDLTAGVTNALLSSGLLPLEKFEKKENIYEELKPPTPPIPSHKPRMKPKLNQSLININKSSMKKGISEPNLAKGKFFSPRALFDRFKRILPLSLSKQSLNDTTAMTIDSDDSESLSSEYDDQLRTSRLDHVSRVKNVYDTLTSGTRMNNLFTESNTRELQTFYDYILHILPEQDIGYFANGNGCLSSSNIHHQMSNSNSIRFKYPYDAKEELTLKYFCFPDQLDSNNNNSNFHAYFLSKKTKPEYFHFTLTDMHGTRQHGFCSRFIHKGILNALCLISPYNMNDLYEKVLATATELFLSYKDEEARKFLKEIYPHRLPNRGDTIHIHTTTVGMYTLKCEYDRRKQMIDANTLLNLSTDTIIKIFSSILYEQKLIFIGNELGPLTRLINTFITLLYPFSWPHTYIPILPALMLDIIQAPTPYIIGILRSCEQYLSSNDEFLSQDNSDILIVDIDHDRIRSINDYLSNESIDDLPSFQILPKMFKIELKQEISFLRKNQFILSLDECQQRLQNIFMSIFVQSCYNYKDYFKHTFIIEQFIQSKHHTIELFLEWFTRTQIFQLFIRQKFEFNSSHQFAITFDLACEKYRRTMKTHTSQRITAKSVKRKAAIRANNRL